MEVIPAIDLRGGRCVRLRQGDYGAETVFDGDPVDMARRFVKAGARRIHVVDLDGARDGVRVNKPAVAELARNVGVTIQVGGGIRDALAADQLLASGVDRVIFGTAAIEAPEEVSHTIKKHGADRVVVSVDARQGEVATRGWEMATGRSASGLMAQMAGIGVRRFIYTDIVKDGTLEHPDFAAIGSLLESVRYPILVAGGIATIDDLARLARLGAEGAITGLAVHSGAIDLEEAIKSVETASRSSG